MKAALVMKEQFGLSYWDAAIIEMARAPASNPFRAD